MMVSKRIPKPSRKAGGLVKPPVPPPPPVPGDINWRVSLAVWARMMSIRSGRHAVKDTASRGALLSSPATQRTGHDLHVSLKSR